MTCREVNEYILDYRSGHLSPEECARFEAHLARCPDCVEDLRSYEETIRLGKGAFSHPDDPVPADVLDELVRAILAARPRARHWPQFLRTVRIYTRDLSRV